MGSIPQLSIIKGPTRQLTPNLLNRLFENIATGLVADHIALIFNGELYPLMDISEDYFVKWNAITVIFFSLKIITFFVLLPYLFKENGQLRQHTYAELNKITNKLARTIQQSIISHNLPRNSDGDYIVAVNMQPSDHLVMTLLAIWKAGAAYLPLDNAFPGPRIEHIVREAQPAIIIHDQGNL